MQTPILLALHTKGFPSQIPVRFPFLLLMNQHWSYYFLSVHPLFPTDALLIIQIKQIVNSNIYKAYILKKYISNCLKKYDIVCFIIKVQKLILILKQIEIISIKL